MCVSGLSLTLALIVDFVNSHLESKECKYFFLERTKIETYLIIPTANSEVV